MEGREGITPWWFVAAFLRRARSAGALGRADVGDESASVGLAAIEIRNARIERRAVARAREVGRLDQCVRQMARRNESVDLATAQVDPAVARVCRVVGRARREFRQLPPRPGKVDFPCDTTASKRKVVGRAFTHGGVTSTLIGVPNGNAL